MEGDPRKKLFGYLSRKGLADNEDQFNADMDTEAGRRSLYETMSGKGLYKGSWEDFDWNLKGNLEEAAEKERKDAAAVAGAPVKNDAQPRMAENRGAVPAAKQQGTGAGNGQAGGVGTPAGQAGGGNAQPEAAEVDSEPVVDGMPAWDHKPLDSSVLSNRSYDNRQEVKELFDREMKGAVDKFISGREAAGSRAADKTILENRAGNMGIAMHNMLASSAAKERETDPQRVIDGINRMFGLHDSLRSDEEKKKWLRDNGVQVIKKGNAIYYKYPNSEEPVLVDAGDGLGTRFMQKVSDMAYRHAGLDMNQPEDGKEGEKVAAPLSEEELQKLQERYGKAFGDIVQGLEEELMGYLRQKEAPEGAFDYIVGGAFRDSMIKQMWDAVVKRASGSSGLRKQLRAEADMQYEEGLGWFGGIMAGGARGALTMGLFDAPVFAVAGAGSSVVGRGVGRAAAGIGGKAFGYGGKAWAMRYVPNVISSGLTFGNYDLMGSAVQQYANGKFDASELAKAWGKGLTTGSVLGTMNSVEKGVLRRFDKMNTAQKYAVKAGAFTTEVGFFTAQELGGVLEQKRMDLAGKYMQEGMNEKDAEARAEEELGWFNGGLTWAELGRAAGKQTALIGMLKGKGAAEQAVMQRIAGMKSAGFKLSPEAIEELKGYDVNMMLGGKVIDPKVLKKVAEGGVPEAPEMIDPTAEQRAEAWQAMMEDPNISIETKQVVTYLMTGAVVEGSPVMDVEASWQGDEATIIRKDAYGNVISRRKMKGVEAQKEMAAANWEKSRNRAYAAEENLGNVGSQMGEAIMQVSMAEHMSYGRVVNLMNRAAAGEELAGWEQKLVDGVVEAANRLTIEKGITSVADIRKRILDETGVDIEEAMKAKAPTEEQAAAVAQYNDMLGEATSNIVGRNEQVSAEVAATDEAMKAVDAEAVKLMPYVENGKVYKLVFEDGREYYVSKFHPEDPSLPIFYYDENGNVQPLESDRGVKIVDIDYEQYLSEYQNDMVGASLAQAQHKANGHRDDVPVTFVVNQSLDLGDGKQFVVGGLDGEDVVINEVQDGKEGSVVVGSRRMKVEELKSMMDRRKELQEQANRESAEKGRMVSAEEVEKENEAAKIEAEKKAEEERKAAEEEARKRAEEEARKEPAAEQQGTEAGEAQPRMAENRGGEPVGIRKGQEYVGRKNGRELRIVVEDVDGDMSRVAMYEGDAAEPFYRSDVRTEEVEQIVRGARMVKDGEPEVAGGVGTPAAEQQGIGAGEPRTAGAGHPEAAAGGAYDRIPEVVDEKTGEKRKNYRAVPVETTYKALKEKYGDAGEEMVKVVAEQMVAEADKKMKAAAGNPDKVAEAYREKKYWEGVRDYDAEQVRMQGVEQAKVDAKQKIDAAIKSVMDNYDRTPMTFDNVEEMIGEDIAMIEDPDVRKAMEDYWSSESDKLNDEINRKYWEKAIADKAEELGSVKAALDSMSADEVEEMLLDLGVDQNFGLGMNGSASGFKASRIYKKMVEGDSNKIGKVIDEVAEENKRKREEWFAKQAAMRSQGDDDNGNVIPLSQRFSEKEDLRFRGEGEQPEAAVSQTGGGFYSPAEKAVMGVRQEKATGEQWLKMIEKAGGLKKEEDKWMGLSEWLRSQPKSVAKEDVLRFIRENSVKVGEVELPKVEEAGRRMWGVDVTPEMKESVMGGQPMWRKLDDDLFAADGKGFDELWAEANEKNGVVTDGLENVEVSVVAVEKNAFGEGSRGEKRAAARAWAKSNLQGTHTIRGNEKQVYSIGAASIDKFVNDSAIRKSADEDVHFSVLKKLLEVIDNSIDTEVHTDRKKIDGVRGTENANNDVLIHRLYGAVEVDGKVYRVKTTMKETKDHGVKNPIHSYEVTKIELLGSMRGDLDKQVSSSKSNNSISGAKLLNGVEKSYESGKYLLGESKKSENPAAKQQGTGADIEKVVEETARKVNVKVNVVRAGDEKGLSEKVQKGLRRGGKGWYDPKTGEVYIYTPNAVSAADAVKTILHEVVGHKGLRELIGKEQYDDVMIDLYGQLPDDVKVEIGKMAEKKYKGDIAYAMDEYFAGKAEEGVTPSWWGKVVGAVRSIAKNVFGMDIELSDGDVKYLLWRSYKGLRNESDWFDLAEDIAMRSKNKVGEYAEKAQSKMTEYRERTEEIFAGKNSAEFLKKLDEQYFAAMERDDEAEMRRLVNEAAESMGYSGDSSYQGSKAFNGAAPSRNGYYETREERKQAFEDGELDGELSLGDYAEEGLDGWDLDWQLKNPARAARGDKYKQESINNLNAALRNGDGTITMYRAVDSNVKEGKFRNGDWITPSKEYAKMHIGLQDWKEGRIIEQKVSIDDIWWDGNDINEWGYDDGREKVYRNSENNAKLLDLVTYDDNGKVIPLSKRFDGSKVDERFAGEGDKSLVGVHNLTEEKLMKVLKAGGLANPSTAVIDVDKTDYSAYGNISLVMPSRMVDRKSGRNAGTWTADAWTPTYPPVEKVMSQQGWDAYFDDMRKVFDASRDDMDLKARTRSLFESWLERGGVADDLAYWYMKERGMNPEKVRHNSGITKERMEEFDAITDGGKKDIYDLSKDELKKYLEFFAKEKGEDLQSILDHWQEVKAKNEEMLANGEVKGWKARAKRETIESIDRYGVPYRVLSEVRDTFKRAKELDGSVDYRATLNAATDKMRAEHKEDFEKWLEEKQEQYGVREQIFTGYTPSGNRKYIDNTLENASRLMTAEGRNNSSNEGTIGSMMAAVAGKADSIDEIRSHKGKLGASEEETQAFKEKWSDVMWDVAQSCYKGDSWAGLARLNEALGKKDPFAHLKKEYGVTLSMGEQRAVKEFIKAVREEFPAGYFETKFERPVMLNEFAGAVVPKSASEKIKNALKEAGLAVFEYDPAIEGDRKRAQLEASDMEGVRFRFDGETGAFSKDWEDELRGKEGMRIKNKEVAEKMEKKMLRTGKRGRELTHDEKLKIKQATGWERGADGMWRHEEAGVDVDWDSFDDLKVKRMSSVVVPLNLADLIGKDNELFESYPKMMSIKVDSRTGSYGGVFSEEENRIGLNMKEYLEIDEKLKRARKDREKWDNPTEVMLSNAEAFDMSVDEAKANLDDKILNLETRMMAEQHYLQEVLNHEIQHAIQRAEGFAQGGNKERIRQLLKDHIDVNEQDYEYAKKRIDIHKENMDILFDLKRAKELFKYPKRFLKMMEHYKYNGSYDDIVKKGQELSVDNYFAAMDNLENTAWHFGVNPKDYGFDTEDYQRLVDMWYKRGATAEDIAKKGMYIDEAIKVWEAICKKSRKDSDEVMDDVDEYDRILKMLRKQTDHELYERLAGEVEARNAAYRMDWTEEQRRNSLAEDTERSYDREKIDRKDQIIRRWSNVSMGSDDEGKARIETEGSVQGTDGEEAQPRMAENRDRAGRWVVGRNGKMEWKSGEVLAEEQEEQDRKAEEQSAIAKRRAGRRDSSLGGRYRRMVNEGAKDWKEFVMTEVAGGMKFRPDDTEAGTQGLLAHTTGNRKDVKAFLDKKGEGLTPEEAAEKIWGDMPVEMQEQCTDQDVFNEILDLVMSYKNHSQMMGDVERSHMMSDVEGMSDYEKEQADGYARNLGFDSWDEYTSQQGYLEAEGERIKKEARDRYLRRIGYDGEEDYQRQMANLDRQARKAAMKERERQAREELIAAISAAEVRPEIPERRRGEDLLDYAERVAMADRARAEYDRRHPVETLTREQAMDVLRNNIVDALQRDSVTQMDKRTLNSILKTLSRTDAVNLPEKLDEALKLVRHIQDKANQRDIDRMLKMKVSDVNGKNMSIAKNVDDRTRRLMEDLNGRVMDVQATGLEDKIHTLRSENWHLREERRGVLEDPEAVADIDAKIEANNEEIADLTEQRRKFMEEKSMRGDVSVDNAIDRLKKKMDDAAVEGKPVSEGDVIQMTALQLHKIAIDNAAKDGEIMQLEDQLREAKKAKGELWEAYKDRLQAAKDAVDAEPRYENVEAWKELSREYVKKRDRLNLQINGLNKLISEATAQKIAGQEAFREAIGRELAGGKDSLLQKIMGMQKRRSEMISNAMHDITGGNTERVKVRDTQEHASGEVKWYKKPFVSPLESELWMKKIFTSALGSFEYMAQTINERTLGKDGWFYRQFVSGEEGVIEANNGYIRSMKSARERLDEKVKEIFGEPAAKQQGTEAGEAQPRTAENRGEGEPEAAAGGKRRKKIETFADWWKEMDKEPKVGKWGKENGIRNSDGEWATTGIEVIDMDKKAEKDVPTGDRVEADYLSKGQATYAYMLWKMADGRAKLEMMGFDDASMEQVRDYIGAENVKMADWVQGEFFAEEREKVNERYLEMYNTSMAAIENYVPIKINSGSIREEVDLSGDSGAGAGKLVVKTGALVNRKTNVNPVDLSWSAAYVIWDHLDEVEDFYYFAPVRRDLGWILSSQAFRNQLNKNSHGAFKRLVKAAEVATHADQSSSKAGQGELDKVYATIQKGLVGGNIAFRNNTALKQMLSVPAFLGYSQDPRFLGAFVKNVFKIYGGNSVGLVANMATFGTLGKRMFTDREKMKGAMKGALTEDIKWCLDNVPDFWDRVLKGTAGDNRLDEKSVNSAIGRFVDGYMEVGMRANQMVDALTCAIGIKTIYEYKMARAKERAEKMNITGGEKAKYLEEQHRQAIMEATIYYNGTQQSNHKAFLSPMQVGKSFVDRANSLYQNASIGYARKFVTSVQDMHRLVRNWDKMAGSYSHRILEEQGINWKEAEPEQLRQAEAEARSYMANAARKKVFDAMLYGFFLNYIWDMGGRGLLGLFQNDDDEEKGVLGVMGQAITYPARGTTGMNILGMIATGGKMALGLSTDEVNQFLEDYKKAEEQFGAVSPEVAYVVSKRASRFMGVNPDTWINTYMGTERMIRDGVTDRRKQDMIIDLMFLLNSPESQRAAVAKKLYSDRYGDDWENHVEEYVHDVERAMKYKVEEDQWEDWLPNIKALKKATEDKLRKEFIQKNLTPEEKEALKKAEEFDKWLKNTDSLTELEKRFEKEDNARRREKIMAKFMKEDAKQHDSGAEVVKSLKETLLGNDESSKQDWEQAWIRRMDKEELQYESTIKRGLKDNKRVWDEWRKIAKEDEGKAGEFEKEHEYEIEHYRKMRDAVNEIRDLKKDWYEAEQAGDADEAERIAKQIRKRLTKVKMM